MPLVLANRVKETTTTTGTGTVTLAGAAAGYQSFAVVGNGNTTYYTITDSASGAWEVGIGTYTSSGTTLSRTTVLASSNAGALVPFGSGAKDVFVTYPAEVVLAGTTQSVSPFETSLGAGAGTSVTGVNNTLVGYNAGNSLTTGTDNAATGWGALYSATTGSYNVGVGSGSAPGITTGSYNIGVGYASLNNMPTASDNVAVGVYSGGSAFGAYIQGNKNTAIGNYSLIGLLNDYNATSVENTAAGYAAMQRARNADYCAAFGAYALGATFGSLVDGDYNAAFGHSAGRAVTSGAQNTLLGANAGYSGTNNLTTGSNNIIIGYNAAASSATVSNEATIGNSSVATFRVPGISFYADAGSKFGWGQGTNGAASSGIAFGFVANQGGTGASNICIGDFAGRFEGGNTGGSNVFIGGAAGVGTGSSFSSPYNVGIGASALQNVSGGGYNTSVGYQAGDKITTGTNNVTIGYSAASSGTNDLTTGTNNIIIGYNAAASSATVSNEVTIGNASVTSFRIPGLSVTWGANTVPYRNVPPVGTKTGSYTLAVADVGKYVQVGSGGSITIPDATFAEGDVVSVFNNTTGNITITCTITTAYIAGTDSDKASVTLATRGVATILFISSTICVISGNVS